jgi:hypothetical protein
MWLIPDVETLARSSVARNGNAGPDETFANNPFEEMNNA